MQTVIRAPLAGTVFRVLVHPGDMVVTGQEVLVLESMKMEIPIEVQAAGTVHTLLVREGDFVDEGDQLMMLS
jgi:acetyl-CoA carboxylase biotin carboxyl carrier protein